MTDAPPSRMQAPATPTMTRARLRIAAALLGPARLLRSQTLQASERAALTLRATQPRMAQPEGVTFLIPLVGPHHVGDWDGVQARLRATLDSLLRQTDPRWRAVICCQTRPDMPDDPRLHYLPFDDPAPGNDKWRKLTALCDYLPRVGPHAGYTMSLDADDLLHPDMVATLMAQAKDGWLVGRGLVMDAGCGDIALAGPRSPALPLRKPFWKLCGSCMALRHDLANPACLPFLRAMVQHEHRMFPYLVALAGMEVQEFDSPMALYILNHGENFGARRGRVGFKTRFVQRFKITDPAMLAQIRSDFALDDSAP